MTIKQVAQSFVDLSDLANDPVKELEMKVNLRPQPNFKMQLEAVTMGDMLDMLHVILRRPNTVVLFDNGKAIVSMNGDIPVGGRH